jgi:hypothetical protein
MLKIIFSFCVVAIFLAGCSNKENDSLLNDFNNKRDKFEQIQNTNKVTISQNGRVVGFITGLYQPDAKYEKFLVGVYSQEELQNLHFTLDEKDTIRVEELQNSDYRLKQMPLKNKWSRYFEVTFIKSNSNVIKLNIINGKIWNQEMVFSKVPNYLNSK